MIVNKKLNVKDCSGVYRWWFREEDAKHLLNQLPNVEIERILKHKFNGDDNCYWALYFGISKNLKQRIVWHICQAHTTSAVKSGFLSTLRQTISALLNKDMTRSQADVNNLMEDSCYWEWDYTESEAEAIKIETMELSQNQYIYPLNLAKNKTVSKKHLKCLEILRKNYRK